jgi:transcriptional regulator with XRE-family HTH domain
MTRGLTPYAELADILDRLGPLVCDARRARGLTQHQVARAAMCAPSTVASVEAGNEYTSTTARRLLTWLDTTTVQPQIGGRT